MTKKQIETIAKVCGQAKQYLSEEQGKLLPDYRFPQEHDGKLYVSNGVMIIRLESVPPDMETIKFPVLYNVKTIYSNTFIGREVQEIDVSMSALKQAKRKTICKLGIAYYKASLIQDAMIILGIPMREYEFWQVKPEYHFSLEAVHNHSYPMLCIENPNGIAWICGIRYSPLSKEEVIDISKRED